MLLLSLPARKMKRIEPVIDYNKSHIVTFNQYLDILQQKVTKKEAIEQKKTKKLEREEQKVQ
jgi:precorrin-3B methylase